MMDKITSDHDAIFWLIRSVEGLVNLLERQSLASGRPNKVLFDSIREEVQALHDYGKTIAPYTQITPAPSKDDEFVAKLAKVTGWKPEDIRAFPPVAALLED